MEIIKVSKEYLLMNLNCSNIGGITCFLFNYIKTLCLKYRKLQQALKKFLLLNVNNFLRIKENKSKTKFVHI